MNPSQSSSDNEIFIRNLAFSTTQDGLRNFFKACGNVENVSIPKERDGRGKGIAFVRFSDESGVQKAVTLSGQELDGRTLFVEKKKPKTDKGDEEEKRPYEPRKKVFSRAGQDEGAPIENEIFVRNIPFNTEHDDLQSFFQDCGKVESVKIVKNPDGRPKGIAFIKFQDDESTQKAIALDGRDFNGREIRVEVRRPREDNGGRDFRNSGPRQGGNDRGSPSVFVGGLSYTTTEENLRNFFDDCGKITAVRIATDHEGNTKGFAHIDFESADSVDAAIDKSNSVLDGRTIRVDLATSKKPDFGGRGGDFRGGSRGSYRGSRGGY